MPAQKPAVVFDLDGTLTDSKPGIVGCLRKVLNARGIDCPGPLDRFVGPPVEEWVVELLPEGSQHDRAALAAEYRACYDREGWSNNSVFAGVVQMLADLRGDGFTLYACTSKQHRFAVRILDHFGLSPQFAAIYGDRSEFPNHGKAELLARLIAEQALDSQTTWMVGDRIFDVEAARANGVRCLFAGWGYGPLDEGAQADAIARTPAEVRPLIHRNA